MRGRGSMPFVLFYGKPWSMRHIDESCLREGGSKVIGVHCGPTVAGWESLCKLQQKLVVLGDLRTHLLDC